MDYDLDSQEHLDHARSIVREACSVFYDKGRNNGFVPLTQEETSQVAYALGVASGVLGRVTHDDGRKKRPTYIEQEAMAKAEGYATFCDDQKAFQRLMTPDHRPLLTKEECDAASRYNFWAAQHGGAMIIGLPNVETLPEPASS